MAYRHRRALIAALAGVAAFAGANAHASGGTTVPVRAHLTYTKDGSEFRDLRLTITRGGRAWRSGALGTTYFSAPRLSVRDLDADGEPEVWFDVSSGGAHCCLTSQVFRYAPKSKGYRRTAHAWGNVDYRATNLSGGGAVELVSADDRFAYVFTSFAGSFFPLRIWHFDRGKMQDVTRTFPRAVRADAAKLWSAYARNRVLRADPRGVLAAWLADQYLLGRAEQGLQRLKTLEGQGVFGPRADLAGWPQGRAYLRALEAYLKKLGYA